MKLNEEAFARLQQLSDLGISKRGAAKILYNDPNLTFTSVEQARTFVRRHTNANGKAKRY